MGMSLLEMPADAYTFYRIHFVNSENTTMREKRNEADVVSTKRSTLLY